MSKDAREEAAIELKNVSHVYTAGEVRALRGITLAIQRGEFVAVIGPSGSGKSTLLNLIGGLDLPTEGEIFVNGRRIDRSIDLDNHRRREIGFVFQLHNLIPNLTLLENVLIPAHGAGDPAAARSRAEELLRQVGLEERAGFYPVNVSGGQRQRAAIARALINQPPVLLCDEPTGSVDSKTGAVILAMLLEICRSHNVTLVVVTHNEKIAEAADRRIEIVDGAVAASS